MERPRRPGRTRGFAANEGAEFFARADEVARSAGISHDADFYETWGALDLGRGDLDAGREKLALALERSEDPLQRARINRLLARAESSVFNSKEATRYALAGLRELDQTPPTGGLAILFGTLLGALRCLLMLVGRRRAPELSDDERARLCPRSACTTSSRMPPTSRGARPILSTVMRTFARSLRLGPSLEVSHTLIGISVIAASFGSPAEGASV